MLPPPYACNPTLVRWLARETSSTTTKGPAATILGFPSAVTWPWVVEYLQCLALTNNTGAGALPEEAGKFPLFAAAPAHVTWSFGGGVEGAGSCRTFPSGMPPRCRSRHLERVIGGTIGGDGLRGAYAGCNGELGEGLVGRRVGSVLSKTRSAGRVSCTCQFVNLACLSHGEGVVGLPFWASRPLVTMLWNNPNPVDGMGCQALEVHV
jgi:hypothetical protein